MKTTNLLQQASRHLRDCLLVLGAVSCAGCFRTLDPSKLTCDQGAGCPSGYYCAFDQKRCVPATGPRDAASPADIPTERGPGSGGAGGVRTTVASGGAGGTGGVGNTGPVNDAAGGVDGTAAGGTTRDAGDASLVDTPLGGTGGDDASGPGGRGVDTGAGGVVGTGGIASAGGMTAKGGSTGTGDNPTGGVVTTGGLASTGGLGTAGAGTGGVVSTGGVASTGGMKMDAGVDAPACPNGKLCGSRCVPANGCCDDSGCTSPQTCGGGGTPDVCGCTRTTTCTAKCGNIVDNCGATLSCGTSACLPGQTCGTSNTCICEGRQCTSICCPTAPAGTASVCLASGTQCGTMCNPGTHSCGATEPPCYSDTDIANCGVEGGPCVDCRQPNTNQACGTGAKCSNTCLLSQVHLTACTEPVGKPNCSQWQFESGSAENWDSYGDSSTGQPTASTAQHFSGSWSLSQALNTPAGQTFGGAFFKVLLCVGKEASSVAGKAISGEIRFEPPPSGNTTMSVIFFTDSAFTNGRVPEENPRVDTTPGWIGFNIPFPDATGMAAGIGIGISFNNGSYNGTVYLDDVMLQ